MCSCDAGLMIPQEYACLSSLYIVVYVIVHVYTASHVRVTRMTGSGSDDWIY
jgi:hypothetical protein